MTATAGAWRAQAGVWARAAGGEGGLGGDLFEGSLGAAHGVADVAGAGAHLLANLLGGASDLFGGLRALGQRQGEGAESGRLRVGSAAGVLDHLHLEFALHFLDAGHVIKHGLEGLHGLKEVHGVLVLFKGLHRVDDEVFDLIDFSGDGAGRGCGLFGDFLVWFGGGGLGPGGVDSHGGFLRT